MNILQKKILKKEKDMLQTAIKYYKIIMVANGKSLTEMEYNLLGFLATYGTITSPPNRQRFIQIFNSTESSIITTISNMYKKGLIEKINGKNIIHHALKVDFSKPLGLNIMLLSPEALGGTSPKINPL